MGALNIQQSSAMMKERVLPDLPTLWGVEDTLCTWLKPGKAEKISDRAMRIPQKAARGGITTGVDLNGGSFPRGSGTYIKQGTITTVGLTHARELTSKAIYATDSNDKAVEKALRMENSQAMIEFKCQIDRFLQVDNAGVLAIANTVTGAPTYSVKGGSTGQAGNPWGAQLLIENNVYDWYDSTLTTLRQAGAQIVQDGGIDYPGQTITMTAPVAGAVIGDKLTISQMANAALFGLPYHINDSSSGTWQGYSRSLPYVQARSVDAGGSAISLDYIRQSINLVRIRKGVDMKKRLTPYTAPQQEHAYEQLAFAVTEVIKSGPEDKVDLMFDNLTMAGRRCLINSNADPTKIQWIDRASFGWAEMKSIGFHDVDGVTVFPVIGSNGVPQAQIWFALTYQAQLFCIDVTNMAYIKNLAVIPGYVGA